MKYFSVGLVLLVVACAQPAANVMPVPLENFRTLNKSYDDVWYSVAVHVNRSLYGIKYIKKNMGLITVAHYTRNPFRYVSCNKLNGNHAKPDKGQLVAAINIYVQKIAENKTSLKVVVLYTFSSLVPIGYRAYRLDKWVFKTGTLGEANGVRCQPTNALEQEILDAASLN